MGIEKASCQKEWRKSRNENADSHVYDVCSGIGYGGHTCILQFYDLSKRGKKNESKSNGNENETNLEPVEG